MNPATLFADKLFTTLARSTENQFVSPYGIWTALGMLLPGARGETGEALASCLGFGSAGAFGDLAAALASRSEPTAYDERWSQGDKADYGFYLEVANSMWGQRGYAFEPAYVEALQRSFAAEVDEVDFGGAPDDAVERINSWVSGKTRGKIEAIVSRELMNELTRLILVNSIYFKARWQSTFETFLTKPGPFRRLGAAPVEVPMMNQQLSVPYGQTHEYTVATMSYVQPDIAMDIVLPHPGHFESVVSKFSMRELSLVERSYEIVRMSMPRFELQSQLTLSKPLAAIGLGAVFSSAADLSGISAEREVFVDEVVHKTFVKVDETGTEAAAVTAIAVAGSAPPQNVLEFVVDRPFLFVIRDVPTETALFYGVVVDPTAP